MATRNLSLTPRNEDTREKQSIEPVIQFELIQIKEHFEDSMQSIEQQFAIAEKMKEEGYELDFDEATNHYIHGTWGWGEEFGNSKEVTILLPNDEDVNRLKGEIESLNVAATVNTVLLTEVAKQFNSYAQGEISLEEAINTVVDNLDLYLSE